MTDNSGISGPCSLCGQRHETTTCPARVLQCNGATAALPEIRFVAVGQTESYVPVSRLRAELARAVERCAEVADAEALSAKVDALNCRSDRSLAGQQARILAEERELTALRVADEIRALGAERSHKRNSSAGTRNGWTGRRRTDMAEMILIALEGGPTVRRGEDVPCGFLQEGFCVALAATPGLQEAIDAIGADGVARMLEENGVDAPPTGGLWVLETQPDPRIQEDEDKECGFRFRWLGWRKPTLDELAGMLARQDLRLARARDRSAEPTCGSEIERQWTFRGGRA